MEVDEVQIVARESSDPRIFIWVFRYDKEFIDVPNSAIGRGKVAEWLRADAGVV